MTCIAAAVNRETGEFVMGGDSAASTDMHMMTTTMPKVFQNGEMIIGTAGSIRWQQLLTYLRLPRCAKKRDPAEYMATDFAFAIRDAGRTMGCLEEEKGILFAEGHFLVAMRGRVWRVQPSFDAFEVEDGLVAVGSGEPFALGAMKALAQTTTDLRAIVEGALAVAEYYSTSVRGPFTILVSDAAVPDAQAAGRRRRPGRGRAKDAAAHRQRAVSRKPVPHRRGKAAEPDAR